MKASNRFSLKKGDKKVGVVDSVGLEPTTNRL